MRHTTRTLLLACFLLFCLAGCSKEAPSEVPVPPVSEETVSPSPVPEDTPDVPDPPAAKVVVIDAGHQASTNTEQEPIGPGAAETKMKVSGGTAGAATGIPEYQLTLTVSQLLREELEGRGYDVVMVRETSNVDLSNRQRADVANQSGGDIFLRIHANGSENPTVQGAMTLCPTPQSPYPIGALYDQCRLLSDCVLDGLTAATGATRQAVWETGVMSGINWCEIPVTIVEMGYQSNPQEDILLNSPDYQEKIVDGLANGVEQYFARLGL